MTEDLLPDLLTVLACPLDRSALEHVGERLRCGAGHDFPVVEGIPVLLTDEFDPTLPDVFASTWSHLDSPGALSAGGDAAKAFVRDWIVRTNGNLYRNLAMLPRYPIPSFPVEPRTKDERLLDVGGNWGRWAIAAAQRGFRPTVLDPNLEAAFVGRRIASDLGVDIRYVVGDARSLPFVDGSFEAVFSYSVLQHFDKTDACGALAEMGRILPSGGRSVVQMPNVRGIRQATNLVRQRLARSTNPFRVRYWTPRELVVAGDRAIGTSHLSVDGYFSLNPRPEDRDLLPGSARGLVTASEGLKRLSRTTGLRWIRTFADSLWLISERR